MQEAYGILSRFEVPVTKEEAEGVDTLRYSFVRLQSKAVSGYRVSPKVFYKSPPCCALML